MHKLLVERAASALMFLLMLLASAAVAPMARALTFEEALTRARARAPDVLAARARIAQARAEVRGAEVLLREDPSLQATGGPRYTADGVWIPQLSAGLSQRFELSGARDARIAAALAGVDQAEASSDAAVREAVLAVGTAFVGALHARDTVAIAQSARERAEALLAAAEARGAAGDAGAIEVRRLRISAAQARAEAHAAAALSVLAIAQLRALLDLGPDTQLEVEGQLADLAAAPTPGAATERPELAALRAGMRATDAQMRVADAMDIPELGVGIGYQFEEGDHMGLLTLSVTLPVFDRGHALREAAQARRGALEARLELRERAISSEVAAARQVLEPIRAALEESTRGLEAADELDTMIEQSWRAGETSLTELLVVRAEVLAARRAHLDRQRDVGLARVALEAALGLESQSSGDSP